MSSPTRTCIGCRRRGPATDMLRLRAGGIGAGRGASLHLACVEKAMRPEVLSRAFKRPVVAAEVHQLSQQLSVASRRKRL